jgi:hypothetical protein
MRAQTEDGRTMNSKTELIQFGLDRVAAGRCQVVRAERDRIVISVDDRLALVADLAALEQGLGLLGEQVWQTLSTDGLRTALGRLDEGCRPVRRWTARVAQDDGRVVDVDVRADMVRGRCPVCGADCCTLPTCDIAAPRTDVLVLTIEAPGRREAIGPQAARWQTSWPLVRALRRVQAELVAGWGAILSFKVG